MEVVNLYSCVECDEVITHPVGEEHLALAFKAWLLEVSPKLEEQFTREYVARTNFISDAHKMHCIISGKKMATCPYCTATQFITWLHAKDVSPHLVEQALDFFLSTHDKFVVQRLLKDKKGVSLPTPLTITTLNERAII